jgi:hypothetical protein
MAYQGTLGQAGQITVVGANGLTLPTLQIQQDDATKVSYVLIPSAIGAMLDTEAQAITPITANGQVLQITSSSTLTQVANDKIAMPTSYSTNAPIMTLNGSNASVQILPILLTAPRAKAILRAMKAGTLSAYYDGLLTNAKKIFANAFSGMSN